MVEIRRKDVFEGDKGYISLPKLKDDLDWNGIKIAFAKAKNETGLPDPFSRAVKAAINISAFAETKVMPTYNFDWDDSSSDREINSCQDEDIHSPGKTKKLDLSSLLQPIE